MSVNHYMLREFETVKNARLARECGDEPIAALDLFAAMADLD